MKNLRPLEQRWDELGKIGYGCVVGRGALKGIISAVAPRAMGLPESGPRKWPPTFGGNVTLNQSWISGTSSRMSIIG